MTVEAATFITELDETLPADTDVTNELDEHIRLVKQVLQNTLPGDGGPDIFDQALLALLSDMNSWDLRLTQMEALPTSLPPPMAGSFSVPAGSVGTSVSVTGLGFQPQQIIFCSASVTAEPQNHMSFASWTATTNNGQAHSFWQGPGDVGTMRSTQGISLNNEVERNEFSAIAVVSSTNADGFVVSPNIADLGTDFIYMAFP